MSAFKRSKGQRANIMKRLYAGLAHPKRRIKQTPITSAFKGLTSSQLRKLQKEN